MMTLFWQSILKNVGPIRAVPSGNSGLENTPFTYNDMARIN